MKKRLLCPYHSAGYQNASGQKVKDTVFKVGYIPRGITRMMIGT